MSKAVPGAGSSRDAVRFRTGKVSLSVLATGLLIAGLAGCSAGASPQQGTGASADAGQGRQSGAVTSTAAVQPSAAPIPAASTAVATQSAAAGGPLPAAQKKMADVLGAVVAGAPKPGTEQIRQALTAAGFPATTLEVSASRTPTGLDVDSVEAAAVQGQECVIGQIRDGRVTVTVLPVLASGKCFVGAAG